MTNNDNSTPPLSGNWGENFLHGLEELKNIYIEGAVAKEQADWNADLVKAMAMSKAWFASATASELEELEAGRPPKSHREMMEVWMKLTRADELFGAWADKKK
jgi:hypothetical protein